MKISECCGAPAYSNGDGSTEDYGICPECGEHCEYEDEDNIPEWEKQFDTDYINNQRCLQSDIDRK